MVSEFHVSRMDTEGMRMKCKQKSEKRGGEGGGTLCSLFLRRRLLSDSILTGVSVGSDPSYGFAETFFRGRVGVLLKGTG